MEFESNISTAVCFREGDGAIGYKGKLHYPYGHLRGDGKHYLEIIEGNNIIVSRPSWEEMGPKSKTCINRSIIITRNPSLVKDCGQRGNVMSDPLEALERCKTTWKNEKTIISGGGQIYDLLARYSSKILATVVIDPTPERFPADAFFHIPEGFVENKQERSPIHEGKDGLTFYYTNFYHFNHEKIRSFASKKQDYYFFKVPSTPQSSAHGYEGTED